MIFVNLVIYNFHMETSENILNLSKLITVLISGIFGLVVAVITWVLANFRENKKFKREFDDLKIICKDIRGFR